MGSCLRARIIFQPGVIFPCSMPPVLEVNPQRRSYNTRDTTKSIPWNAYCTVDLRRKISGGLSTHLQRRIEIYEAVYILGLVLIIGAAVSSELSAGDLTIYTGFQNPGKLTVDNITRDTKLGSVIRARISAGRVVGFEQIRL